MLNKIPLLIAGLVGGREKVAQGARKCTQKREVILTLQINLTKET